MLQYPGRCFLSQQNEESRGHLHIAALHLLLSSLSHMRTSRATVSGSVCACSTTRLRIISIFEGSAGVYSSSDGPRLSGNEVPFSCASSCFTVIGVLMAAGNRDSARV